MTPALRVKAASFTVMTVAVLVAARMGSGVARPSRGVIVVGALISAAILLLLRARRLVLCLTVLSLVLGSSSNPALKSGVFFVRFALLGLLVMLNVASGTACQPGRRERTFVRALIALSVLGLCSVVWSVDRTLTLQRVLGISLLFGVISTAARFVWQGRADIARDVKTVTLVLIGVLAVGLGGMAVGASSVFIGARFRGILENPNAIGILGAMLLPLSVAFAIEARRLRRILWIAGVAVIGISLVLSASRGGIAGASVGLVVLVARRSSGRGRRLALSLVAVAAPAAVLFSVGPAADHGAVPQVVARFTTVGDSGRSDARRVTLDVAGERPIGGWGFGTVEEVLGPRMVGLQRRFGYYGLAQNGYLVVLLEIGPIGLLLTLFAISSAVGSAWAAKDIQMLALLAALAGGMFTQLVEGGLTAAGSMFALTFWLLAMAAVRLGAMEAEVSSDTRELQDSAL